MEDLVVGMTGAQFRNAFNGNFTIVDNKSSTLSLSGQAMSRNGGGIMLRYDDGYLSHYTVAFEIHKKYRLPGLSIVVTDFVGGDNFMTWAQLIEMQENGFIEIGLHGRFHESLSDLTTQEIYELINDGYVEMRENMPDHYPIWYCPPYNDSGVTDPARPIAYRLFKKQSRQHKYYEVTNDNSAVSSSHFIELPGYISANLETSIADVVERVRRGEFIHMMCHNITDAEKYEAFIVAMLENNIPIFSPVALANYTHNLIKDPSFSRPLTENYTSIGDESTLQSTHVYAGVNAVKISFPERAEAKLEAFGANYLIKFEGGHTYRYSVWVKCNLSTGIEFRYIHTVMNEILENAGTTTTYKTNVTTANKWVLISGTFTYAKTRYANVGLGVYATNLNAFDLYIDSLSVIDETQYDFNGVDVFGELTIDDLSYADGDITVTVSGGCGPYEYCIDDGEFQESNVFTVGSGTYAITVRDRLMQLTDDSIVVE